MIVALWVAVLLALVGVVVMGAVLAGTLREIEALRERMGTEAEAGRHGVAVPAGLPVGSAVPRFDADALDGTRYSSRALAGRRHLVLFAHPGCTPCEALVPDVIRMTREDRIPPTVLVSRGESTDQPPAWRAADGARLRVVLEREGDVSARFDTAVTPHVFVVTDDGRIEAQGIASSPDHVRELLAGVGAGR